MTIKVIYYYNKSLCDKEIQWLLKNPIRISDNMINFHFFYAINGDRPKLNKMLQISK